MNVPAKIETPATPVVSSADVQELSLAERLVLLPEADRSAYLEEIGEDGASALLWDWRFWGRPKQFAPEGSWRTWMLRAGRGFGKTRTGTEWVQERAMAYPRRWIALVAKNPADARDYMVEGPGGFLRNVPPWDRPVFEPSKKRLTWKNGSWATIYSDEEPDQLRGFSGDTAWVDEIAKFRNIEASWDNLQFGMREASSDQPRVLVTTTPRPLVFLSALEALETTAVTHGSTYENRSNLDEGWFNEVLSKYKGTRLGRQEIEGHIINDVPNALWKRSTLDATRVPFDDLPPMVRILVAVDPSGTDGPKQLRGGRVKEDRRNDVGIVVVGLGEDKRGYVLADRTCNLGPEGWGAEVVRAYRQYAANAVVAETNFGGAMVRFVVRAADKNVPYYEVNASRGKVIRADPVSLLFERGEARLGGFFPELEDELCSFGPDGKSAGASPNRLDAMVWGFTKLMLENVATVTTRTGRVRGLI